MTGLSLPIPRVAPAEFHTEHVTVAWRLSFEFLVSFSASEMEADNKAIKNIVADTVIWSLAIKVLPSNPATMPCEITDAVLLL